MKHFLYLLISLSLFSACHKEEQLSKDPNARLAFSTDTVFFDTLFTSVTSVTKRLKVYNPGSKAVVVSSIELEGKASSPYKLIINGLSTSYQSNVELRGGDSLYILVNVRIDPANTSLPFLVNDSIRFATNGNTQYVQLVAYGQKATFFKSATIACDTIWKNTQPFVIYDFARVAPGCTLTIDEGVKVYFHKNAFLKVEGTLIVKGSKDSLVTFSGDQLSVVNQNVPGQWNGLQFEPGSRNNTISYCQIKNATNGILMKNDPADSDTIPDLFISNSVLANMKWAAFRAEGRDVYAVNCLFTNSVQQAFAGVGGGNYYLEFCTLANYSYDFYREQPALRLTNSEMINNAVLSGDLNSRFINCIVWGDARNEVDFIMNNSVQFNFSSAHSFFKTTRSDLNVNGNSINLHPQFVNPRLYDFQLADGSPAINGALPSLINVDLNGKPRDANADVGCYEK